eukprot:1177548-Prorocentrum_minimum.AAC.5
MMHVRIRMLTLHTVILSQGPRVPSIDVERLLLEPLDHVRVPGRFAEAITINVLPVARVKQPDPEVSRARQTAATDRGQGSYVQTKDQRPKTCELVR